jgi:mRNA-degrading endonuclease toxin of MazEF toxin-antitoxin module
MKTITSISGGKASSMMAVEFPTDHYVFSVVLTDQIEAVPKDKGLLREIRRELQ